jgi:inner membrane protein
MTDTAATPPPSVIITKEPGLFRLAFEYLRGDSLMARAILLALLTAVLTVPLGLIGGVVSDRRSYEREAINNVTSTWGRAQTFAGPMLRVPYKVVTDKETTWHTLTVLPEKLTIDSAVEPSQRHRGLFAVTVYKATLDVVAEFRTKDLQLSLVNVRTADWSGASLVVGLSDPKSIDAGPVTVDGQETGWSPDGANLLSSIKASLNGHDLRDRDRIAVNFRLSLGGSEALSFVPLGRRTEVSVTSSWQSPSYSGRYLPVSQSLDQDGMRARWTVSHLGRRYGQAWDSNSDSPSVEVVLQSAFGFTLLNPVDAYRETDRAIKYAIMIIGLTFTTCLLFEMATGTRPSMAQYGLIGLSLCVFYLLLLSLSEQVGFAPAYLASALAVVAQAATYNWAIHRRRGPALLFALLLAGLYGGLYTLLQLEDVALLSGSLLLFLVLSLAMWFTRNLHRPIPA